MDDFNNYNWDNFCKSLVGVTKCHSVRFSLAAYLRNAKPKTVASDQPAQKKCKTNSGPGSASNSRIFQPQWLKQFDWLEYDAETKRLCCKT